MIILGIETSCDETAAAVLSNEDGAIRILSNVVASSAELQQKWGGIVPEQAAREQLKSIIPVITEALKNANLTPEQLDAIAVTQGPGLIGSLLVGVETAKTLSLLWNKPLIPVNHLIGHFYANWIDSEWTMDNGQWTTKDKLSILNSQLSIPSFPCIGLLVSGGHSDLVLFTNHGKFTYLGGTRDDAAGECFDKSARLLGYSYPGGPKISKFAEAGDENKFKMPVPMSNSQDFDYSFSGLKTHFLNLVETHFKTSNFDPQNADLRWKRITSANLEGQDQLIADLCASLQKTIIKSLIKKTIKAMKQYGISELIVAGGVAANKKLRQTLQQELEKEIPGSKLRVPEIPLCMDNAAMIASAAFFLEPVKNPLEIQANPNLSLAY